MNIQFPWRGLVAAGLVLAGAAPGPAAPVVSNVCALQREGTKLVDITYDLYSDSPALTVTVQVATNGGINYDIPATHFSGDCGAGVTPGTDKQILWDAGADWNSQAPTQVWFLVTADDGVSSNEYLVIDLEAGAEATSYPVSYLTNVPPGGWTAEYKTTKMVLRKIPAGSFTMGSPTGELGHVSDETQHRVVLTRNFYLGVFECSGLQYTLVTGVSNAITEPYQGWAYTRFTNQLYAAARPTSYLSYYEIREDPTNGAISPHWPESDQVHSNSFMGKLRAKTGLATLDLPTEAQWEYACRAGTTNALNSGKEITSKTGLCPNLDEVACNYRHFGCLARVSPQWSWEYVAFELDYHWNYGDTGGTATVGSYLPNPWGLYDMHGNVWEWCLDWYTNYPAGTVTNPVGPPAGSIRVQRGGGFSITYPNLYRSAARNTYTQYHQNTPDWHFTGGGFRVAWNPPYQGPFTVDTRFVAIITEPESRTNTQGTAASFSVGAEGLEPIYYQWQKNGTNLDVAATAAVYTLAAVTTDDAGQYRCLVSNVANCVTSAAASLTVDLKPVVAAACSNIMATSAYLGGEILATNGYTVTNRGIYWGTNSGVPLSHWNGYAESGDYGTGSFSFLVTDLPAGRTNYLVACAANSQGTFYSAVSSFLTRPGVPGVLPPTNGTLDSCYAHWQATTGAINYRLDVSLTNDFSSYLPGYSNRNAGALGTCLVTGLQARTLHYYRVRAENEVGASDCSATQTVSAAALVAPASLTLTGTYGGANPAVQKIILTNSGDLGLTFTNTVTYLPAGAHWWTASPASGSLHGQATLAITGAVNLAGLDAGTYQAINTFSSAHTTNSAAVCVATLTVGRAPQALTAFTPANGTVFALTSTVVLAAQASSGLPATFEVVGGAGRLMGDSLTFSAMGTMIVKAKQEGSLNYFPAPSITNTYQVGKCTAGVTLGNLRQVYDGTARPVTASTAPAGLTVTLTYDGHSWAPTNAGRYAVTGTVNTLIYDGVAAGTLVVARGSQAITFPAIPDQIMTNTVSLHASADSGLPATFAVASGPAVLSGGSLLNFTGTGAVSVTANQAGNANWNPAAAVVNTFRVSSAIYQLREVLAGDFDGDRLVDPAMYEGATGDWYFQLSAGGYTPFRLQGFGGPGYMGYAADFDGDRQADPGIYSVITGDWTIQLSSRYYSTVAAPGFGGLGIEPLAHDFDGDRQADPAIYNTTNGDWSVMLSGNGYRIGRAPGFGGAGSTPVPGHFDADLRTDPAIFGVSSGSWRVMLSASGYGIRTGSLGGAGATPVVADFDGDGLADIGIYRENTKSWIFRLSSNSYGLATLSRFGGTGYVAGAADFDGDLKADPALYNPSTHTLLIKLSARGYAQATCQF